MLDNVTNQELETLYNEKSIITFTYYPPHLSQDWEDGTNKYDGKLTMFIDYKHHLSQDIAYDSSFSFDEVPCWDVNPREQHYYDTPVICDNIPIKWGKLDKLNISVKNMYLYDKEYIKPAMVYGMYTYTCKKCVIIDVNDIKYTIPGYFRCI